MDFNAKARRGEGRRVDVCRVRRFAECIDVGAVLARDERGGVAAVTGLFFNHR